MPLPAPVMIATLPSEAMFVPPFSEFLTFKKDTTLYVENKAVLVSGAGGFLSIYVCALNGTLSL
jgi:hypothetical protein